MLLLLLLTLINLFLSKLFWLLQTYLFPINQKNPLFQNYFGIPENGHRKVCPKLDSPKKFAKKKFFLMLTNKKTFSRKWERLVGKSLFRTFRQKSAKICKIREIQKVYEKSGVFSYKLLAARIVMTGAATPL